MNESCQGIGFTAIVIFDQNPGNIKNKAPM
jgi:hypothetical protein